MSILFALQAFTDNSNLDLIIRFVHHKCRSEDQNIVEMEETKAHIYCLYVFFFLFSINSLPNFFLCMNDKYLSHEDLFQCDTIRQDGLTF